MWSWRLGGITRRSALPASTGSTRALRRSICRQASASTCRASSASAPVLSMPAGPRPTTTTVKSARHCAGPSRGSVCRSVVIRRQRRIGGPPARRGARLPICPRPDAARQCPVAIDAIARNRPAPLVSPPEIPFAKGGVIKARSLGPPRRVLVTAVKAGRAIDDVRASLAGSAGTIPPSSGPNERLVHPQRSTGARRSVRPAFATRHRPEDRCPWDSDPAAWPLASSARGRRSRRWAARRTAAPGGIVAAATLELGPLLGAERQGPSAASLAGPAARSWASPARS